MWRLSRESGSATSRPLNSRMRPSRYRRVLRFVASVATLGGALGTGPESDEAIRAAAYSKREEERRARLAGERT